MTIYTTIKGDGSDIFAFGPDVGPTRVLATDDSEIIKTGGQSDIVIAAGGDDIIMTNHGKDFVDAGDGNDEVKSQGSADVVYGRAGDDTLDGGGGNDRIIGGTGDDIIIGGNGDDVLYGDLTNGKKDGTIGADTFVFDANDGTDKIWDFVSGLDDLVFTDGIDPDFTMVYKGGTTMIEYFDTVIKVYGAEVLETDLSFFI